MQYPCIGRGNGTNGIYLLINPSRGILLENHPRANPGHIGSSFKSHRIPINEFLTSKNLTDEIFRNLLKYWYLYIGVPE